MVPASLPQPMTEFIKSLTRDDILARPQSNLFDDFIKVRQQSFGRVRSGMKNIPGFES